MLGRGGRVVFRFVYKIWLSVSFLKELYFLFIGKEVKRGRVR